MRKIIFMLVILSITNFCYADRVILLDKNGKHIMTSPYSDKSIEAMKKDAKSSGFNLNEVTIKRITEEEWKVIKEEQIDRPIREQAEQKKIIRLQKETEIKQKLNLSDNDFNNLKEALGK